MRISSDFMGLPRHPALQAARYGRLSLDQKSNPQFGMAIGSRHGIMVIESRRGIPVDSTQPVFVGTKLMERQTASVRKQLVLVLSLTLPAGGCDSPTGSPDAPHIKQFATLYEKYKQKHGKPPNSTDELKEWVKKLPKSETESLGVEDVDKACISPRDQQPYVIVSAKGAGRGGKGKLAVQVLVHERTGVNGKRLVLMPRGYTVMEMDEARFREAVPGAP
jgi:hypothetical protein